MTLIGANIGGLADGSGNVASTNYNVPDPRLIIDAGLQAARIGFKSERWYDAPNYQLALLTSVAKPLTTAKVMAIIDAHEFGSVWSEAAGATIGLFTQPGLDLFQKLWADIVARILALGLDMDYLCLGLQNEPGKGMSDVDAMATVYQPIITAARAAGYKGYFAVPEWESSNASNISPKTPYLAKVVDPLNRTVLELHGYGDGSNQGLGDVSANVTTIHDRFVGAGQWFALEGRAAGFLGLLAGEFGAPNDSLSEQDFTNAVHLFTMEQPGVWWAATAWTMDTWLNKNGNFLGSAVAPTPNLTVLMGAETPLVVYLAGDAYQGVPIANILVDSRVVLENVTVAAIRTGAPQAVRVPGVLSPGAHTVGVQFIQDAWGGKVGLDRNLYLLAITYAGMPCTVCPGDFAALPSAGIHTISITVPG